MSDADPKINAIYKRFIRRAMIYKDDEIVKLDGKTKTTDNLCLHYVVTTNNLELVTKVHHSYFPAAGMKNMKIIQGGDDVNSSDEGETFNEIMAPHETPKEMSGIYVNLTHHNFRDVAPIPPPDGAEGYRSVASLKWRALSVDQSLLAWHIETISFYSTSNGASDSDLSSKTSSKYSSGEENNSSGDDNNSSIIAKKDDDGNLWIAIELYKPLIVQSIKLKNADMNGPKALKLQAYDASTNEWVTTFNAREINVSGTEQLLNYNSSELLQTFLLFPFKKFINHAL